MKKRFLSILLAALMLLSLLPVSALAEEEPDYTSVEVTEYSFERVMDLAYRLHDENSQLGTGGGFTWDLEGEKRSWTYYNGIMMDAFLMLDSENFESYVNTFYNNNVTSQGQVNSVGAADNYYRENELDSVPPARALFDLLRSEAVSEADKSKYKRMIDYVYFVLSRFEVIPGSGGNFRHKMNNANWETYQLALDGMYMAQPFFMELANALDDGTLTLEDFTSYTGSDEILEDTDKIYSAVFDRMFWVGDNLYDDGNGLYNHAWGPDAGLNGQYWLRAVGWYAAALADVISMLPDNFAEERDMLIEIETRLFDGMIAHQDRETGLWYNVINYGPELSGPESMNLLESSGSALMAYAMMRSYAEGFVGRSYGAAGLRTFNAIAALKLDEGVLYDVYLSSGVETTPEGYLSKPYVTNEAKGVGPLFMAATWAKQAADLYNQPVAVPLCAVDGDTNEALPGVTAQVLDGDGALVAEWNSGTETLPVEGILPGAEYTIHVTEAPTGYELPEDVAFSLDEETLQIILNGDPIDDGVIDIRLFKNKVSIVTEIIPEEGGTVTAEPADPAEDELVTLTVEPAQGYVLKSLTVTDEAGNEIFPDEGQFYMPDGSVTVTAVFEKTRVRFDAVDAVRGERLAGAALQLLDDEGGIADEWQSGDGPHLLEGLPVEREYTLRVSAVPEGYLLPADTIFSLNADGSVDYDGSTGTDDEGNPVLLVELDWTRVRIDAVDVGTGDRLAGAVINLYDPDGILVDSWSSSNNETHCRDGLFTGAEFTLHADCAPEGYLLPADTIFSLNADGSVDYDGSTTTDDEDNPVLLVEFEKTSIRFDAVDADGNRLAGAVMQILDADGDVVDEWTSGSEPYCVEGLTAGEEYVLMVAIPADGYCVWPEAPFTIEFDGSVTYGGNTATDDEGNLVLLAELAATRVCFSVRDADTGEAIPGVTVHVTDCAGDVITDWISDDTGYHAVEKLIAGMEYTVRVIDAPEDYLLPEDASFVIDPEGNVTYSGNTGTNNIFETLLLVELKKEAVYPLSGGNVVFFDENFRIITEAAEGKTVTVSPDFESIPAGYWFTGAYEVAPAVEITVDEAGDGTFTMPAGAVSVTAVLAEQEDYDLLLADGEPVELPAEMAANLSGTGAYFYDETLDVGVLDLNGDGEPDVLLDFDADTAQRLAGADAITHSVTLSIDAPVPYRYRAVCFRFNENQSAGPVITQQPADVSVALGELARTRVVAEGEGLKYQWYGREANGREFKSGLRGDTYSVALVKSKIGRTVWCVITDAEGNTVTTREAVLNVAYPEDYEYPTIIIDETATSVKVSPGETAVVTVAATGYGALNYQWYIQNKGSETQSRSSIKGPDAAVYSVAMTAARDGRAVWCVVTDAWGNSATSEPVTIGYDRPEGYERPTVTVNADDIHTDVDAGEVASVTVTAVGPNGDAEGLSYQWYLRADENAPWSRSSLKGDTYSVKMVPSKSGRQVKCVVTDAYGKKTESAVFTLTMVIPAEYHGPSITGQPGNVTVARGEIAATTVAADGEGLTYQWYGREANGRTFRSGLTGPTYSVAMVPSKSGRQVWCVVTDKYGRTVTSNVATLTMAP